MLAYIVQYDNIKKWASFLSHIHVFDFFFIIFFFFGLFLTKWRQRHFETQSTRSPQAPAELWRLYGVISMVTAVTAISTDWVRATEVEKEIGCLALKGNLPLRERFLRIVNRWYSEWLLIAARRKLWHPENLCHQMLKANTLEQNTHFPSLSVVKLLVQGLYFSQVVTV